MRGMNDTTVTINAAATAIQSAENRGAQSSSVQKRRWKSCLNISWCFGSNKQSKKIGHAVLVPEPMSSRSETPATTNPSQPPSIILPFIAPPSSPASFRQSEPPSAAHSPGGMLSFTSVSGSMYSPSGPSNIFAIGPYAHETQLGSPPVFSTYTTEPSTAPFTPPPESVHLTTPSSPEVPYARLLGTHRSNEVVPYEFQSYQLYPGSPMGQLTPVTGKWGSGSLTPESGVHRGNEEQLHLVDHRVSFEVTPEQVVRCVERRRCADVANGSADVADGGMRHQKHRSTTTLGSVKEFNFDSTDGADSDWWATEKVNGPIKNWSFFPMMQPGVS